MKYEYICDRCHASYYLTELELYRTVGRVYKHLFKKYKWSLDIWENQEGLCVKCIEEVEKRLGAITLEPLYSELILMFLKGDSERLYQKGALFEAISLAEQHYQDMLEGKAQLTSLQDIAKYRTEDAFRKEVEKRIGLLISSNSFSLLLNSFNIVDYDDKYDEFDILRFLSLWNFFKKDLINLSREIVKCYDSDDNIYKERATKSVIIGKSQIVQFLKENGGLTWKQKRDELKRRFPELKEFPSGDAMRKYCKRHKLC
jgi:hypothetical protein